MSLSVQDVFDMESIVPAAVKTVLVSSGFAAYTALDAPVNQRQRPRVEVYWKSSGAPATGGQAVSGFLNGQRVNAGWVGELILYCITAVDEPGKLAHAAYRSALRYIMSTLIYSINGVDGGLQNHKLQWLVEGPTNHGIRAQDAYEQSTLSYAGMITAQANVWNQVVFQPIVFSGTN